MVRDVERVERVICFEDSDSTSHICAEDRLSPLSANCGLA